MKYSNIIGLKIADNVRVLCLVVPIRKLLSAQLSKTLVNRCFFINQIKIYKYV